MKSHIVLTDKIGRGELGVMYSVFLKPFFEGAMPPHLPWMPLDICRHIKVTKCHSSVSASVKGKLLTDEEGLVVPV